MAHYGLARLFKLCGEDVKAWEQGEESLKFFLRANSPQVHEVKQWLKSARPDKFMKDDSDIMANLRAEASPVEIPARGT
jgi:hypothetical protein